MGLPKTAPEYITPWIVCDCCEDYICTIHDQHVFECDCPAIDDWVEADLFPYAECEKAAVMELLNG